MISAFGACRDCARKEAGGGRERVTPLVYFWGKYPASTHRLGQIQQIDCLICLPDKSGNFLVFRAKRAQNTVKPENTGFGMAIIARPGPVFYVFGPKISRTFYFKLTEQSSRKKLAEGGFEPEKVRLLYPAPRKKLNKSCIDTIQKPCYTVWKIRAIVGLRRCIP